MISGIDATVLDARTLPSNDNVNAYAFSIALDGEWFTAKGAMIAYYGSIDFSGVSAFASRATWVAARFSSPLYAQEWVVASRDEDRLRRRLGGRPVVPEQPRQPVIEPAQDPRQRQVLKRLVRVEVYRPAQRPDRRRRKRRRLCVHRHRAEWRRD